MLGIIALVITLKVWHILVAISIITGVIASILDSKESGGYIPSLDCSAWWLFLNLVGWLIYFIIV